MSTNDSLETTPRLPVHAEQKAARTGSTHAPHSTPGPWYVGAMNDELFIINGLFVIAKVANMASFTETQANGNLIAAAPDLYKALRIFVEHFGDPGAGQLCGARAALAKAEGRS